MPSIARDLQLSRNMGLQIPRPAEAGLGMRVTTGSIRKGSAPA